MFDTNLDYSFSIYNIQDDGLEYTLYIYNNYIIIEISDIIA